MSIAWTEFTPWSALAGGILIGLAASMFVLLNGRIAGISGVIGGLFKPVKGDVAWRALFVLVSSVHPGPMHCLRRCHSPASRRRLVPWSSQDCWWVWARDMAQVAPADTACAAWRACRRGLWWQPSPSWRPASRPCLSPAMCSASEETLP